MLHIYLDTALLAIPNYAYGTDANDVQELIDRVIHFSIVLSQNLPLRIMVADNVEEVLGVDYPGYQSIQDFLDQEGLTHVYSTNDLLQQYQSILDRAARPEQLGTFEVYEASAFSAVPPLPPTLSPADLVVESERVFTTVAVQAVGSGAWRIGSAMNGTSKQHFTISATVDEASHDPSPADGPLSFTFTRFARTIENLSDLAEFAAAEELWQNSQCAEELHLAVMLGALALKRGMHLEATLGDLKPFSIGSEFMTSLRLHQCAAGQRFSSTTFQLCTQIVADLGVAEVKEMGKPRQERRERDGAGAHRTHITGGKLALRLMHWRAGDLIEFANVGVKHALHIEQGAEGLQTSIDLQDVL